MVFAGDLNGVTAKMLEGFCDGWKYPLSGVRLLQVLQGSFAVQLAMEGERVIGFANALSDGAVFAYIPLLEVRPEYQHRGIGTELVRRLISRLEDHYGIDLLCDAGLVPFYERQGMTRVEGMCRRNLDALR